MKKQVTSLEKKRETLMANGVIKADLVENVKYQKSQPHGFALNLCGHCNFRCSYCPQSTQEFPEEFIEMETVRRLLNDTKDTPSYFQFGTRGENLLHPHFFDIIHAIKQSNPLHYITLNTNGVMMEGDFAEKVIRSGIDQLTFSLQSIKPEIYTALTNYQNFDKIINNIISTIKLRDAKKINLLIGIQFLNTKENRPFYQEFVDFWEPYDVYMYSQTPHNWGDKFDFSSHVETIPDRYPCLYLWLYPSISCKGNVCSCFADFYDENNFGNLNEQTLHEIWENSPVRKKMIEEHLAGQWDKNPMCKSCKSFTQFENIFKKLGDRFYLP